MMMREGETKAERSSKAKARPSAGTSAARMAMMMMKFQTPATGASPNTSPKARKNRASADVGGSGPSAFFNAEEAAVPATPPLGHAPLGRGRIEESSAPKARAALLGGGAVISRAQVPTLFHFPMKTINAFNF